MSTGQLDEELASMAMIHSLSDDYSSFVSSPLLMNKLEKATIHQAFHTEETQRRRRAETEDNSSADKALSTLSKSTLHCDNKPGHNIGICFKYEKAQKDAQKPRFQKNNKARAVAEQLQDASKI